jgi:hypothetical protein
MNWGMPVLTKTRRAAESNRSRSAGKLRRAANAVALAMMCTATTVQAEPIIFNFNCTLVNATTCTPTTQFASMTLSDSAIDPNRVDIDVVISPQAAVLTLDKLYLNYGGRTWIYGYYLSLIRQTAPMSSGGDHSLNALSMNGFGPFGTGMDIVLRTDTLVTLGLSKDGLSFSGSLVVKPDPAELEEVDLDAAGFQTTNTTNLVYAVLEMSTLQGAVDIGATLAYRPSDLDVLPIGNINLPPPPDTVVNEPSGAVVQAALPEPGTLGLLGVAAAFLGSAIGLKKRSRA